MKQYTGLLAIDPGKTTGWARFNEKGEFKEYGQVTMDELIDLENQLYEHPISHIVTEDFRLFRHKANRQIGSRMEAAQVIGIVFAWSKRHDCEFIKQDPNIKPIAEKWSEVRPPTNHAQSHWVDAHNHGFYYLVKRGLRKSALEERKLGERKEGG